MPYIGTTPTKVVSRQSANVYRYTATAGQTAFTGADLDNNVLACNPADMIVHMNGLRLESTDYTATSTTVTLTTAATAGDEVTVTSFVTFEVADTYTKTAADSRYVNTTGDTMTGALVVSAAETNDIIKLERTGSYAGSGYIYANQNQTFGVKTGAGQYQLMVDSAGRVTMPYQPAIRMLRVSGGANIPQNASSTIPFDYTEYSSGITYNASNGRFTVPTTGVYFISVNGRFNNHTSMPLEIGIRINGATRSYKYIHATSTSYHGTDTNLIYYMGANDYFDAYIYQGSGSTQTLSYNYSGATGISAYLLG